MPDFEIFKWLTSTIEGLAFVEWLLALAMVGLVWYVRQVVKRLDAHETSCNERQQEAAEWRGSVNARLDSGKDRMQRIDAKLDRLLERGREN